MKLGNFPKADCGRFWILASTHVDQPKSTEKLNKTILLNLNYSMTGLPSSGTDCMTGALMPGAVGTLSLYIYNHVRPVWDAVPV